MKLTPKQVALRPARLAQAAQLKMGLKLDSATSAGTGPAPAPSQPVVSAIAVRCQPSRLR
jgi:hypothetical protein